MRNIKRNKPSLVQLRLKPGFRKTVLAVALAASVSVAGNSYAGGQTGVQSYQIPAGPLGTTLSNFAVNAGMALSFDPALTEGLTAAPVSGDYTASEAVQQMLAGSGLQMVRRQDGSYTLQKAVPAEVKETLALPVVTVTGEKIERRLEDTLSSVAVITSDDIRKHADNDVQNIMARTPGVYTQSGNENWGIRGVPVDGFDEQGAATMNGAISVFVDGAVQTHRLVTLNPLRLWDVEQVEVFRGSQSTTQGRNSLAGAVVMKTKDPTYEPEFAAQTNIGKYGEQGASFVAGGALVDDVVAGRLAFDYQEDDGYIRNETLDTDGNASRAVTTRGKLLIQPTDKLDLLLTVSRNENKRGAHTVSAENGRPFYYKHFLNTKELNALDQNAAVAKLDYYLSDNWTLTSTSSGTWAKYRALLDFDSGVDREREAVRKHEQRLLNQELRLNYDGDRLTGFFGAYYGTHTNDILDQINLKLDGIPDPALVVEGDAHIRNTAVFGEANWEFADHWQLHGGLRYDREKNHTRFNYTDPLGFATVSSADMEKTFNELLPKVGISHELSDNHLIGLEWKRGYRGGGVDLSTSTEHLPYDPEYTSTYELSWRGAWLDKSLRTSLNIFHTNWRDQQVEVDRNGDDIAEVVNAAESRMRGLEFSADYRVTPKLELYFGTSYVDSEFQEFVVDGVDLSGKRFEFAPRLKATFGAAYTFNNGLRVAGDIVSQSNSFTLDIDDFDDDGNNEAVERKNPGITLVNLNAEYKLSNKVSLSGYVRNLFDREYITNNQGDDSLDVGAPRTFGVALRVDM
ncbi:TonB-dependent receptor domain-containing protein [Methylophaga sp. OBS4]|uniref:TonB-dependent receptor domain-containing protein n=1 Tax=Methylophaga sp. OBS4 TaxID=2991935 RepID=UPI002259370D|nr:TonB-dependent receptor [Methylophaga sp. OBS4]MCX4187975.1 TonB-dependent receptor [Methylophaga sp. OBS4]